MARMMMVVAVALAVMAASAHAADGVLYGLSSKVGLVKINPETGKISPDSKPLPFELQAQNLATIDTERGIFYMMGFNDSTNDVNLLGFDTNGTLKYNILLPFISSEFVGVGEAVDVDTTNGEVFCMGLKADGKHHLYRVNPRTGVLNYLSECGYVNVLGAAHAFDIAHNLVWLQYGVNSSGVISLDFFAFDATTGESKKKVAEDPANFMSTLSYDVKNHNLVGFGVDTTTTPIQRTVVQLDPVSGKYTKVATLKEYIVDNGGIATINSRDRVLYGQLQHAGANQTAPFHLVSVNIDTGAVVSAPILCNLYTSPDCPWSMEFLPNRH